MSELYIYSGIAFLSGVFITFIGFMVLLRKSRRSYNSLQGFFESEKLIKERLQKENTWLLRQRESSHEEYESKIQELQNLVKLMDEDILLLQKDNEATQALLQATNPVVHTLKVKLIEANNTIARIKAQKMSMD